MWCPPDFRKIHSQKRRKQKLDDQLYDADWLAKLNIDKQTLKTGHYHFY
jgi:hypothetical protein